MVGKYVDLMILQEPERSPCPRGIANFSGSSSPTWIPRQSRRRDARRIDRADGFWSDGFGPARLRGQDSGRPIPRENVCRFSHWLRHAEAVIEFARNVCELPARTQPRSIQTPHPVIDLLRRSGPHPEGWTMRLGAYACVLEDGSLAHRTTEKRKISERHRHRYEFNNKYREKIEQKGMVLSGCSPDMASRDRRGSRPSVVLGMPVSSRVQVTVLRLSPVVQGIHQGCDAGPSEAHPWSAAWSAVGGQALSARGARCPWTR